MDRVAAEIPSNREWAGLLAGEVECDKKRGLPLADGHFADGS